MNLDDLLKTEIDKRAANVALSALSKGDCVMITIRRINFNSHREYYVKVERTTDRYWSSQTTNPIETVLDLLPKVIAAGARNAE